MYCCRDCCIYRPVVITDLIPRWPAAAWSPEFLNARYSDKSVLVTISKVPVGICSMSVTHIIIVMCYKSLYQADNSKIVFSAYISL